MKKSRVGLVAFSLSMALVGAACSSDSGSQGGTGGRSAGTGGSGTPAGSGGSASPGSGGSGGGGAPIGTGGSDGGSGGQGGEAVGSGGAAGGATGTGGRAAGGSSGTGGRAAGGAGGNMGGGGNTGGGGMAAPLPGLIVSGPSAYWQAATPMQVTSGTADVTANDAMMHQLWEGFGGSFNEAGWDALSVLDAAERERAIRLLFDTSSAGARFNLGRIPIGASDYAINRYSLAETAGDYAMASFSIERDRMRLIPYVKAAMTVQPGIKMWASPWTPPPWMKSNNAYDKGQMKSDMQTLNAFALYLSKFVEEYAKEGIKISAVFPQNEPGYELDYPSCLWTPQLFRDFIRDYLGPTFMMRNITSEIWLGTMSAPTDTMHVEMTMADMNAAKFVAGIGLQWNHVNNVATFASRYGKRVWQTEHQAGNYPWDTANFKANAAPNDQKYAEESWGLMLNWIKAGVTTYSAWNMVLDTVGKSLDMVRPWPQNALLAVDRTARRLVITPTYYVFRHVSSFVDPGAHRIATTGLADALAFKNPDNSIVVLVYNSGTAARNMTVSIRGMLFQFNVPSKGWATIKRP